MPRSHARTTGRQAAYVVVCSNTPRPRGSPTPSELTASHPLATIPVESCDPSSSPPPCRPRLPRLHPLPRRAPPRHAPSKRALPLPLPAAPGRRHAAAHQSRDPPAGGQARVRAAAGGAQGPAGARSGGASAVPGARAGGHRGEAGGGPAGQGRRARRRRRRACRRRGARPARCAGAPLGWVFCCSRAGARAAFHCVVEPRACGTSQEPFAAHPPPLTTPPARCPCAPPAGTPQRSAAKQHG